MYKSSEGAESVSPVSITGSSRDPGDKDSDDNELSVGVSVESVIESSLGQSNIDI